MSVTNRLVFDVTDADTIAASSSMGAFVRSSDGTLITHTTDGAKERLDTSIGIASADAPDFGLYAEDAAHSSGDMGQAVWAVRNDTKGALAGTDGDYIPFQMNASGELYVVDEAANTLLTSIDADTAAMVVDLAAIEVLLTSIDADTAAMAVDLAAIEVLLTSIDSDTAAMVVDLAAIEVLLTSIDSDTAAMVVDLAAIEVLLTQIDADTSTINTNIADLTKAEDAAHSSGDKGIQALAVRNDTLASLADTDGDYAPFQVNSDGALYVEFTNTGLNDIADTALENTSKGVTTTTGALLGSALAARKYMWTQNLGNKHCYVGKSGVTTANGIQLPPGVIHEFRFGPNLSLHGVAQAGTQDVRIMEAS